MSTSGITDGTQIVEILIEEIGQPGYSAHELAQLDPNNPFLGTFTEWRESLVGPIGPQVPVAGELGQSEAFAVSQKLLTDTVDAMQSDSSEAVAEAERLNGLSQAAAIRSGDSATSSAEQAGLSNDARIESQRQAGIAADRANVSSLSAQAAAQNESNSEDLKNESERQANISTVQAVISTTQAGLSEDARIESERQAGLSSDSAVDSLRDANLALQYKESAASAATDAVNAIVGDFADILDAINGE